MKTANKVINDRIAMLDAFIKKTAFSPAPSDKYHCEVSIKAKELFDSLLMAINEYTNLVNGSGDQEIISELGEKIKEIASSTMIPLVERNKQSIDNYKKIIADLSLQKIDLESKLNMTTDGAGPLPAGYEGLKNDLNILNETMIKYDGVKKDTIEYLEEYEKALEEIKELVQTGVSDIIQNTINEAAPYVETEIKSDSEQLSDTENQSSDNDNDELQGNGNVKVYD